MNGKRPDRTQPDGSTPDELAAPYLEPDGTAGDGRWIGADPKRMPLGRLVAWTGQSVTAYYRRTVSTRGLSATSLAVLGVLAETEVVGPSHRDLAGRIGISPATLTSVIDTLEAEDAVVRERDPDDRRIVRLVITPSGRDRFRSAVHGVSATVRDALPDPPPDQERVIRDYLLALLTAVDPDPLP